MERIIFLKKDDKKMKSFIGYSLDKDVRYRATSGGVGSSLLKWLFDRKIIETSISLSYNRKTLHYEPHLIHSFEEYQITGSVYHEIDLVSFIKANVKNIKGGFACFSLPCQTRAIRAIVEKSGHKVFIIGLTCSSQQTFAATDFLLKCLKLDKESVLHIQYRGNGWPGGIQIQKKTGESIFVSNNHSIWTLIFHSRLFIRPKCFMCQDTLNKYSDFTLADPWLSEYVASEKTGKTIIISNRFEQTGKLLLQCESDGYVVLDDMLESMAMKSQMSTIIRKESYRKHKKLVKFFRKMINKKFYQKVVANSFFFDLHCKMRVAFERILLKNF